ncbi:PREDICTED: general transcriptional corepressor trfA-like [Polistes canadensis]|uniref:general transcriptional corepressor trfA-like n=1 Tax=Polistes canadensis TaxID=91411 RepID=UPI000718D8E2|nr:PREDICTED: general transcriptional corepressor trfA-like [Polistes canadensis]
MVNLEDISRQLLKSSKSFSSWNFPLSEILTEYYSLLEGNCDVNFGEAALILQNSVNIFTQRVECLLNETIHLNETFIDYDSEKDVDANESSKCSKVKNYKRILNKNSINFDDFKLCNLSDNIGKNINTKNKFNIEKPVKLLTRRFVQLENIIENPVDNAIKIIDIHGDIIGKKYDFRCNQYLSMNGLLIDEPTPDDFKIMDNNNSATSGYCSNTSIFDSSYNSNNPIDTTNITTDNNTETLTNCSLSPLEELADCSVHMDDFNETDDAIFEKEQTTNIAQKKESQDNSKTNKQLFNNCDTNMNNTDNVCNISNKNQHSSGRVKEIKFPTNMKKTYNSKMWEPISLTHNISIKKKRIDLLNSTSIVLKTERKKKKIISQMHKNECVVNFLLKESKMLQDKYSTQKAKKQLLPQFRSEEVDEIQKVFKDCFKNTESLNSFDDQVINATTNDLRMRTNSIGDDSFSDDTFYEDSGILTYTPSILDCDISPVSSTDLRVSRVDSISSQIDLQLSLPNYERLIEDKMKELFEDSDVKTEFDHKIIKWHQSMQLKFAEVEQRPIFCIQNYASQIMKKLNNKIQTNKNQNISFDDIVKDEQSYDVARYFLALLQLANTYNVDLKKNKTIDERIEIVLLDTSSKDAPN